MLNSYNDHLENSKQPGTFAEKLTYRMKVAESFIMDSNVMDYRLILQTNSNQNLKECLEHKYWPKYSIKTTCSGGCFMDGNSKVELIFWISMNGYCLFTGFHWKYVPEIVSF